MEDRWTAGMEQMIDQSQSLENNMRCKYKTNTFETGGPVHRTEYNNMNTASYLEDVTPQLPLVVQTLVENFNYLNKIDSKNAESKHNGANGER